MDFSLDEDEKAPLFYLTIYPGWWKILYDKEPQSKHTNCSLWVVANSRTFIVRARWHLWSFKNIMKLNGNTKTKIPFLSIKEIYLLCYQNWMDTILILENVIMCLNNYTKKTILMWEMINSRKTIDGKKKMLIDYFCNNCRISELSPAIYQQSWQLSQLINRCLKGILLWLKGFHEIRFQI